MRGLVSVSISMFGLVTISGRSQCLLVLSSFLLWFYQKSTGLYLRPRTILPCCGSPCQVIDSQIWELPGYLGIISIITNWSSLEKTASLYIQM